VSRGASHDALYREAGLSLQEDLRALDRASLTP